MEKAMHANEFTRKAIGRGAIALAALTAGVALASETLPASAASEPIVLAQAAGPMSSAPAPAVVVVYPAYQAKVRAAAAEGPEALRRYIWRTRMIWNFRYDDFAV